MMCNTFLFIFWVRVLVLPCLCCGMARLCPSLLFNSDCQFSLFVCLFCVLFFIIACVAARMTSTTGYGSYWEVCS